MSAVLAVTCVCGSTRWLFGVPIKAFYWPAIQPYLLVLGQQVSWKFVTGLVIQKNWSDVSVTQKSVEVSKQKDSEKHPQNVSVPMSAEHCSYLVFWDCQQETSKAKTPGACDCIILNSIAMHFVAFVTLQPGASKLQFCVVYFLRKI